MKAPLTILSSTLALVLIAFAVFALPLDARTIVVATDGSDDGEGSDTAPFRTLSRAAEVAMPGDTILVRPGVYRERVTPPRGGEPGRPITYHAESLGTVFIRGSEAWTPDWQHHGDGHYSAVPEATIFNDDVYADEANPFLVPLASTPHKRDGQPEFERYGVGDPDFSYTSGQVIVNGKPWEQRPFVEEVKDAPVRWAVAHETGRIHVNFGQLDPSGQRVEITTRRRVFAPHIRGLGHIVVEGFVIEHCGNQYPTNFWKTKKWAQAGALGLRGGHHWIVRNNLIRYANTVAMDVGSGGNDNERNPQTIGGAPLGQDNRIENNYIVDNGAAGIIGSTSTNMVIRGNVILRNNTLGFVGEKRYEHGGIKCHYIRDGLIERNYVADSPRSEGIWLDNQFHGTHVTRNVIVNNGARGIFLEMSDYKYDSVFVTQNISIGNDIQFYVHDASGSTVLHNLFANSPGDAKYGQGCYIHQATERTRTGYHSLFNNLFINHKVMLDINYPAHKSGPQRINHNVYDTTEEARAFVINRASDEPSPWEPAAFFEMVQRDLPSRAPAAVPGGGKVALTLSEWRAFWAKHGQQNDTKSITREGIVVSYDPSTLELQLTVPFDLGTMGSTPHPRMDRDFDGKTVPQDGTALPGPFQSLQSGSNTYKIWHGLPLLDEGELP
ncbi:MAG: right-handed parallel beta-helix repeat-containing protein [Verrucomicrobia bacterium]|nr:right-handed parallel beta-helix repeat-containing protein [Verrucomicrobiota bacterium]